ncbi:MarR family winged helix-turn-helix transcriptional regulator [Dyella koreensis]|uniref:MarR family transcriptional regulator n=1 Tax=Dyella koreensis TaxID=311235 RepID=A0ABW8K6W8_9GAMM
MASKQRSETGAARLSAAVADLRVAIGKLRRRLRDEVSLGDLTWSQVAVLGHLERGGPATVTALAQAEGVRPQSMGATIGALEAADMVSGAPHPTDGRQTLWSLTPRCRDLIKVSRVAREDWLLRTIHAELTPAEQEVLAKAAPLLKRIAEA